MSKIPIPDLIDCAKREYAMRQNVYSAHVAAGRMPPEEADREIAQMGMILETLQWLDRNADLIRDFVNIQKTNPTALAVLRQFPGAEVNVRDAAE